MAVMMSLQNGRISCTVRPVRARCLVASAKVQAHAVQEPKQQAVRRPQLPAGVKPAALAALTNALAVLPAHAEAGKIFDFNLTLPIMTAQFLLLMVFLDKTWFSPVGKALDDRDASLRAKLSSVKDNSGELKALQDEAEKTLRDARKEAQALIKKVKDETQEEQGKKLADTKARIDKELESALANLEKEKEEALKDLDAQVGKLSGEILARVLPEGVKV